MLYPEVELRDQLQANFMISTNAMFFTGIRSLKVFGTERVVFWREAGLGCGMALPRAAYFIAKVLIEIPRLMILAFFAITLFYPICKPEASFGVYFLHILSGSFGVSGYAYVYSLNFESKNSQLVLVISLLLFMMTSGSMLGLPNYEAIARQIFMQVISVLSPLRYMLESLMVSVTTHLPDAMKVYPYWYGEELNMMRRSGLYYLYAQRFAERFRWGSQLHDIHVLNLAMNVAIGVLTRVIAFAFLCGVNREKMGRISLSRRFKARVLEPLKRWVKMTCARGHGRVGPQG